MASLRETKNRIELIRKTLKITSAMKLVASSKLRKAQKAIEAFRPYQETFTQIFTSVLSNSDCTRSMEAVNPDAPVAIVAMASNNSLCGSFNAKIIRSLFDYLETLGADTVFYPIGRKMSDALIKKGFDIQLVEGACDANLDYDFSSRLSSELLERYRKGEISKIVLIYNQFVSTSKHIVRIERLLPYSADESQPDDYILEPDLEQLIQNLFPQFICQQIHGAILNSQAAEHAARTLAMQTASDNGETLLAELSLEYNKARQHKITSEILDLMGSSFTGENY